LYTGGSQDIPVTFDRCIEQAKQFTQEEVASLKLAGVLFATATATAVKILEKEFLEKEVAMLVQRANSAENLVRRQDEHYKKLVQRQDEHYKKLEEQWSITSKVLNMDRLRARGLLSSRGVYEWYLKSVHNENSNPGKKFNASAVCQQLRTMTGSSIFLPVTNNWEVFQCFVAGTEATVLQNVIKDCMMKHNPKATPPSLDEISDFATNLYGTLSNQIHGSQWEIGAVQFSDQLAEVDRCVLEGVCKDLGVL
jgi:hypothetical protein